MLSHDLHDTLVLIATLKVSPTDHSYDGLDNSSQGSTAVAQVANWRNCNIQRNDQFMKWAFWSIVQLQDHSRGNLNYTASPGHHLDYRFFWHSTCLNPIIHLFQPGVVSRRIHGWAQYRMEKTTEERRNPLTAMKQIFWQRVKKSFSCHGTNLWQQDFILFAGQLVNTLRSKTNQ